VTRTGEPLRFLLVGGGGFAVNIASFVALDSLGSPYAAASVTAYLLSNFLMYVGNRFFTFRLGRGRFWGAYVRYLVVGIGVAVAPATVLALLVELVGLGATAGQFLALLIVTPLAFLAFKRWTFRLGGAVAQH
jgi:putative flippase GtrA